jgi:hypothetical protein
MIGGAILVAAILVAAFLLFSSAPERGFSPGSEPSSCSRRASS